MKLFPEVYSGAIPRKNRDWETPLLGGACTGFFGGELPGESFRKILKKTFFKRFS
jgi:hypothetical protein